MQRVGIFVDVQNVYYTVKQQFGCHFNYQKFWDLVTQNREVVCAIAYAIDRGDPKQRKFQAILEQIGFTVRRKPFIQRRDGSAKGDWDVGMTLDMIENAPQFDVCVLASGDGDFDLVVEKIRLSHADDVHVFGVETLTAASLIRAAKEFTPIEGHLLLDSSRLSPRPPVRAAHNRPSVGS